MAKRTPPGFRNITGFFRIFLIFFICWLLTHTSVTADEYHYKNVLVGDRAATMGGAYIGVADDSSGSFYNPAGIAFAYGDSVSGSGNAYHSSRTKYSQAIGEDDWVRDSTTILPNFFGMIKKYGDYTVAISYIVPDSIIEHQDQKFSVNNAAVNQYYLSLHSEDKTNMIGPSLAYKFSDTLSVGISLFYSYRIYRYQQSEFLALPSGLADISYNSVKLEEYSYLPKIGVQYSPFEPLFIGLTISQGILESRTLQQDSSKIEDNIFALSNAEYSQIKTYPTQISLGAAFYYSPSLLFALDADYYATTEEDLQNVTNVAFGTEWFIDATHAIRGGIFTNNDNRVECTTSACNEAQLNMNGLTFGYSNYTRTNSFTLGAVYSTGTGKADVYGDKSAIVDMQRQSITVVFAANYNY